LEDNFPDAKLFSVNIFDEYFTDIIEFLSTRFAPREFTTVQNKNLVVRATDYQLIAGHLYKLGADNILRRCVMEHERPIILEEEHEGIVGGHYAGKATVQDYGGQQFTRIQRNTVKSVMFVKELGNHPGGMRCH
jgi:hypothetical protein